MLRSKFRRQATVWHNRLTPSVTRHGHGRQLAPAQNLFASGESAHGNDKCDGNGLSFSAAVDHNGNKVALIAQMGASWPTRLRFEDDTTISLLEESHSSRLSAPVLLSQGNRRPVRGVLGRRSVLGPIASLAAPAGERRWCCARRWMEGNAGVFRDHDGYVPTAE